MCNKKYKQGYTPDWLIEWETSLNHIKRELIQHTYILHFIKFLYKKSYFLSSLSLSLGSIYSYIYIYIA